jgi:hypothetical protein
MGNCVSEHKPKDKPKVEEHLPKIIIQDPAG